jgi:hypothetical protein
MTHYGNDQGPDTPITFFGQEDGPWSFLSAPQSGNLAQSPQFNTPDHTRKSEGNGEGDAHKGEGKGEDKGKGGEGTNMDLKGKGDEGKGEDKGKGKG